MSSFSKVTVFCLFIWCDLNACGVFTKWRGRSRIGFIGWGLVLATRTDWMTILKDWRWGWEIRDRTPWDRRLRVCGSVLGSRQGAPHAIRLWQRQIRSAGEGWTNRRLHSWWMAAPEVTICQYPRGSDELAPKFQSVFVRRSRYQKFSH